MLPEYNVRYYFPSEFPDYGKKNKINQLDK